MDSAKQTVNHPAEYSSRSVGPALRAWSDLFRFKDFWCVGSNKYTDARINLRQLDAAEMWLSVVTFSASTGNFFLDNKVIAEHRLKLLKKRLLKDPELLTKYKECIDDLLKKGYAKSAPTTSIEGKTWYLLHHAVFHSAKPGKVRVVFDCSAKYRGRSLKDQLLQGPDLTNSLVGVLTRFCEESVALMSDVEAMFHQVRVKPDDTNALCFLRWPNRYLNSQPQEFMMAVHLFGGVSSPSCANFALRKTVDINQDFDPEIVNTVKRIFYVDDCLKSVKSEQDAVSLRKGLTNLLKKSGFHLTKWLSNSHEVIKSIPESEQATSVKDLEFDHALIKRALGAQ